MEKVFQNGIFVGYKIGKSISIFTLSSEEDRYWFVTIDGLPIFCEILCKKDCTEAEIARYVNVLLHSKLIILDNLIREVIPFT